MSTESTQGVRTPIEAVAAGDPTVQEASEATSWFLDPEPESVASALLPINVAEVGRREHWIKFGIQVLDRALIKELREQATITRADGSREVQEMEANLRIAVEGLIDPDLSRPENRKVRGQQYADPADALTARFAHKPGIIDQIAGRVVQASGYDDKDVREVEAAGN